MNMSGPTFPAPQEWSLPGPGWPLPQAPRGLPTWPLQWRPTPQQKTLHHSLAASPLAAAGQLWLSLALAVWSQRMSWTRKNCQSLGAGSAPTLQGLCWAPWRPWQLRARCPCRPGESGAWTCGGSGPASFPPGWLAGGCPLHCRCRPGPRAGVAVRGVAGGGGHSSVHLTFGATGRRVGYQTVVPGQAPAAKSWSPGCCPRHHRCPPPGSGFPRCASRRSCRAGRGQTSCPALLPRPIPGES